MNNATSRRGFLGISGAALATSQLRAFQRTSAEKRLFAYVGRHTAGFLALAKAAASQYSR